jgi:hypothetical protein
MTRKPHNYETHKTSTAGRTQTLERKLSRATKYGTSTTSHAPNARTLSARLSA